MPLIAATLLPSLPSQTYLYINSLSLTVSLYRFLKRFWKEIVPYKLPHDSTNRSASAPLHPPSNPHPTSDHSPFLTLPGSLIAPGILAPKQTRISMRQCAHHSRCCRFQAYRVSMWIR